MTVSSEREHRGRDAVRCSSTLYPDGGVSAATKLWRALKSDVETSQRCDRVDERKTKEKATREEKRHVSPVSKTTKEAGVKRRLQTVKLMNAGETH